MICAYNEMYLNDKECVDKCPDDKKFFIGLFEHGETDINKNTSNSTRTKLKIKVKCIPNLFTKYPLRGVDNELHNIIMGIIKLLYCISIDILL